MDKDLKQFLAEGNVELPLRLFKSYHQLGLSNEDLIVIMQLFAFSKEGIALPRTELISARTNFSQAAVQKTIERLLNSKVISLSASNDAYDLSNLFGKLISGGLDLQPLVADSSLDQTKTKKSLYQLFQREFGRMLTPMELQTIGDWLKKDQFSPELIVTALRQSVNSQILNLRYIEKILLNWKQNHVQTKEQAEADNLRHRQQYTGPLAEQGNTVKQVDSEIKIPLKKIGE
ncbi:DnaD domain protein [Oenococcus sicerae]|uniref:DnaD domain protein n=1 Tax=Oenococcus sicerae TaxID=2203724 RepID=A0AAJ1R9Q0_9LACO|nr:DnaD domain protein [Oenococcus sicerae]MDN6899825.1 DnaD domain protein [Oenococcus sicerae]QAS70511.1 DnaD domain protein [Oenococcus sicerae]VDK13911.1 hypothetical protein OAL24_00710 [Oenococcus sicerae]